MNLIELSSSTDFVFDEIPEDVKIELIPPVKKEKSDKSDKWFNIGLTIGIIFGVFLIAVLIIILYYIGTSLYKLITTFTKKD